MKYLLLSFFLLLGCIFESIFTLPLPFLIIVGYAIFFQEEIIFLFAVISGVVLDCVLFRQVGVTSLFFVCILGAIFAYRQKLELTSLFFFLFISFLGGCLYVIVFGGTHIIVQLLLTEILSIIVFFIFKFFVSTRERRISFPDE